MTKSRDTANIIKQPFTQTLGTSNYRAGVNAGNSIASGGNYNVVVGDEAGTAITTGDDNVAIGFEALKAEDTTKGATAVGYRALLQQNLGSDGYNVAVGHSAGISNTTGVSNTFIGGFSAGSATVTGASNTAVGRNSLYALTSGTQNVAIGALAGDAITTGSYNVALGKSALENNTTASNNTAVGYVALTANTTGSALTAVGTAALDANTTGIDNTAVGVSALGGNTTGNYNVAVGRMALLDSTTASNNTAVGYQAGYLNTTASNNAFLGYRAGYSTTTGNLNTFVGNDSGYSMTTGTKNTILGRYNGNQGGLDIRTSSNHIVLSDGDGNPRVNIYNGRIGFANGNLTAHGNFIGEVGSSNRALAFEHTTNGGVVGTVTTGSSSVSYNTSSDHRLKENVDYTWDATTRLKQLKPARFNFIADPDTTVDGFLAHEAQAVVPECVTGAKDAVDADGNPEYQGIDQSKLVPLLVKTIQELEARITALEA